MPRVRHKRGVFFRPSVLRGAGEKLTDMPGSGLVTAAPIPAERKEAKRPRAKRKEGS